MALARALAPSRSEPGDRLSSLAVGPEQARARGRPLRASAVRLWVARKTLRRAASRRRAAAPAIGSRPSRMPVKKLQIRCGRTAADVVLVRPHPICPARDASDITVRGVAGDIIVHQLVLPRDQHSREHDFDDE